MSKFFKALEEAERERLLRAQAGREETKPTGLAPRGASAPRADPPPAWPPLAANPPSAAPLVCRIEELKARDGMLVAKAHFVFPIPPALHWIQPLLIALPLQLLAYHLGVLQGCNGDEARSLARTVTGE